MSNDGRVASEQALVNQARAGLGRPGFDPSRSMVERLAGALFLAEHPNASWNAGRARSIWFRRAYAALEEMLEPSDAMLAAAVPEPVHLYDDGARGPAYQAQMKVAVTVERMSARSRWQDMVDAALAWPTPDDVAIAMEARRAAPPKSGAVHDSAAIAPETSA